MEKAEALLQIKNVCNQISAELRTLHPPTAALGDKEAQDEIYKTLFELTKNLETIKKLARKIENKLNNDSSGEPTLL